LTICHTKDRVVLKNAYHFEPLFYHISLQVLDYLKSLTDFDSRIK